MAQFDQWASVRLPAWRSVLDLITTLVLLVAGSAMIWRALSRPATSTRKEVPLPTAVQSIDSAERQGSDSAPVVLIEYSEFQCPYCGAFSRDVLPKLVDRYVKTGLVELAFRQYPLEQIHPEAFNAATVALCSGGHFWSAHDSLFAHQADLRGADIAKMAALVGQEKEQVAVCAGSVGTQRVRADIESGKALQISSTPTFLLGVRQQSRVLVKKIIVGAQPLAEFSAAIDTVLSLAQRR